MHLLPTIVSALILAVQFCDGQLVSMFSNAVQADNCEEWGEWGPCIWLKGANPRWQRSYFDQLLPGRHGCRTHTFFKLLRERWGQAFSNVVEYLREATVSTKQCGFCSYQQSCGRKCSRRAEFINSLNPLFVAEQLCQEVDQSEACTFAWGSEGKQWNGCNFWPNPNIALPNVSEAMLPLVNNIQFLNCIPEHSSPSEPPVCRCCCAPFAPNREAGFRCELMQPKEELLEKGIGLLNSTNINGNNDNKNSSHQIEVKN